MKGEHEVGLGCCKCLCNMCANDHTNDNTHEKACCEEHFPMRSIPWECEKFGTLHFCPDFTPETEEEE